MFGNLERLFTLSSGSYRSHIEEESTVIEHCAAFALSDPLKPSFKKVCDHEHDTHCEECREVKRLNISGFMSEIFVSGETSAADSEWKAVGGAHRIGRRWSEKNY